MMALNSRIILAKNINFDKNYKNVLYCSTNDLLILLRNESHFVSEKTKYSFIRDRGVIQTDFNYNDALKSNYIAFQNPDYSNKWFFAFIDNVIYKGDKCTEIEYTIDVFSTWFNEITLKPCFVEREHTNNDNELNTVPENLELGEYITQTELIDNFNTTVNEPLYHDEGDFTYLTNHYIIVGITIDPEFFTALGGSIVNGIPSGIHYIVARTVESLNSLINLNSDGTHDGCVKSIFIVPKWLINENDINIKGLIADSYECKYEYFSISKVNNFEGYVPKNKKLLTYPYCYIGFSNGGNQNAIYKQEYWQTEPDPNSIYYGDCVFEMAGVLTPRLLN